MERNAFIDALTSCDTFTENGAISNSTTKNIFVDQFGAISSYMNRSITSVFNDQEELWAKDILKSLKFIFYVRAISRTTNVTLDGESKGSFVQKGQGMRDETFKRLLWVAQNYPDVFYDNIELLPIVGSWKDIWEIMWYNHELELNVIDYKKLFALVANGLACEETCDLVKKYMPSLSSSNKQKTPRSCFMNIIGRDFMKFMGWDMKTYRKAKSSGKAHEFQKLISNGLFDKLNWNHIPGKALTKIVASKFIINQNLISSYEEWIDKQDDVKFTGHAYELGYVFNHSKLLKHQEHTLNKQFEHLVKSTKENATFSGNVWCALDTSGSMTWNYDGRKITPYDVCTSLGVFFSTLNDGAFHKQVIMFDSTSYTKQLSGTFCQMMKQIPRDAMGGTNFLSVIRRIVEIRKNNPSIPLEDYPQTLLVVSDMQFNPTSGLDTNYQRSKTMLLEVFPQEFVDNFKFVWWNVATSVKDYPSQINDGGTFLLSGFDGSIISLLLGEELSEKEKKTPKTMVELVDAALNQEIFNFLKV